MAADEPCSAGSGSTTVLIIFCRLPVEGKVKTRLAASIGHAGACSFYRACCEHVLRTAFR